MISDESHLDLPDYAAVRIAVVGDVMLDRSILGEATRISPEAPVPVVRAQRDIWHLGGAANVAANLAALGARVSLVGVIGADEAGDRLTRLLRSAAIEPALETCAELATTVKTRVFSHGQQLVRIDDEELPADRAASIDRQALRERLQAELEACQALLISDYAKGVVDQPREWIALAQARGIPVICDPKHHDFRVYAGCEMLTPNLKEYRQALRHLGIADTGGSEPGAQIMERSGIEALCVTCGGDGVMLHQRGCESLHLPAQAREVFDVTGAGDTFVANLAAALAAGRSRIESARLANLAAGIAVSRRGTAIVTQAELRQAAQPLQGVGSLPPVLDRTELSGWAADQRDRNLRIVMTNGCFDLLHPGHWDCLRRAREFGDLLLVAVNSDASVARLKGPGRPINPVRDRVRMLQGCRDVNAIVVFEEATPEDIIEAVQPDVLVKGADYQTAEVAGAECVRRGGGRLELVPLHGHHSSSALIRRILACGGDRPDGDRE